MTRNPCCGAKMGGDQPDLRQLAGREWPCQQRQPCPVGPGEFPCQQRIAPLGDGEFVSRDQDLDVLRRRVLHGKARSREEPGHHQVDQLQRHDQASCQFAGVFGTLRWKDGGGDVSSEVRAASAAAWAQWLKSRAEEHVRAAAHARTSPHGGRFPFAVEVFG
ncbi:hypothetical protein AB0I53_29070 [Saccharopolyspora sp. NPDC050389]|uniref:hypothetical protein n=1 Tax=Saccharopolyspora sp. NPDC050389 TaxID=3155516 RepID=UPI0033E2E3F1